MTAPCCVLFLDFDGVTHPDPCEADELFGRLPLIEEVLRKFPACSIVISSLWREVHPLDEMREYFSVDIRPRVIGVTPQHPEPIPWFHRQWECERWLQDLGMESQWIAIDDRPKWFRPLCENLLVTETHVGFTAEDATWLCEMLTARCPMDCL